MGHPVAAAGAARLVAPHPPRAAAALGHPLSGTGHPVGRRADQDGAILLVAVPCEDVSSIIIIDVNGKRNELCFMIGSIIKIENNKIYYNKNRLEGCNSDE